MPMEKKGSITVFLALILSLLLSLVTTGIQSVQAAAARTQILNSMDIGLYSLFGQYDRFLMNEYDLFFIDGTQGSSGLNLGAVYDNLESYMKPVLKQNSQKLTLKQGGFTGYRLATDEDGEVFFRQAVTFMRDTLGSQGVGLLLDRYHKKKKRSDRRKKPDVRMRMATSSKIMIQRWIQQHKKVRKPKLPRRQKTAQVPTIYLEVAKNQVEIPAAMRSWKHRSLLQSRIRSRS